MQNTFFVSDTHFGHRNIIKLTLERPWITPRPWSSTLEMDEALIEAWNDVVKPGDQVYHLGDFSFHNPSYTVSDILSRLQGDIHLVVGNHDKRNLKNPDFVSSFKSVRDLRSVKVGDQRIILCHFPLLEWDQAHRGVFHLHGHVHGAFAGKETQPRICGGR